MKNKKCAVALILVLLLTLIFPLNVNAAEKKPSINYKKATITVGSSKNLKLNNYKGKIKWTSSDKNIATVSSKGKVTAKKAGTATITAKAKNKNYKCIITVKNKSKEKQVLDLVNKNRKDKKLNTLTWDNNLVSAAKTRAKEASQNWSHTRPDGSEWYTVSDNIQGENLAKNYSTAKDVVAAWMASQGHKENILRKNFKRTAIASYTTPDGITYWCQAFGY